MIQHIIQERLSDLRTKMQQNGINYYLVPYADKFQSEYLQESDKRLEALTGFNGSWGMLFVGLEKCILFVDGRYTLQAKNQVDLNLFEVICTTDIRPSVWLKDNIKENSVIGYDSWLVTKEQIIAFQKVAEEKNFTFKEIEQNLVDSIWLDKPQSIKTPIINYPIEFAGKSTEEKLSEICADLKADYAILTLSDSVCWLLNIRANDLPHTPYCLSFAVIEKQTQKVHLFISQEVVQIELSSSIILHDENDFLEFLSNLKNQKILLDVNECAEKIYTTLKKAQADIIEGEDPCQFPKACKNMSEIIAIKQAHLWDGIALTKFLYWLSENATTGITEMQAAQKLEDYRRVNKELKDLSFDTIAGFGSNGAIIHYRVTEKTNKRLEKGSLFLLDSGGQYLQGTTDVTRTIAIGTPNDEMKINFTRVLKGHIRLAMAKFPENTTGAMLDVLARYSLWQAGLDYNHGTGHGVGCYLSVHEGPQNISLRSKTPLKEGMILSNEPGYYKEGDYGIRIENLMLVTPPTMVLNAEKAMMGFETLTLAPIDKNLIMLDMLDKDEKDWLNYYHQTVYTALQPYMSLFEDAWLKAATQAI